MAEVLKNITTVAELVKATDSIWEYLEKEEDENYVAFKKTETGIKFLKEFEDDEEVDLFISCTYWEVGTNLPQISRWKLNVEGEDYELCDELEECGFCDENFDTMPEGMDDYDE